MPIENGAITLPVRLVFLCHAEEDKPFVRNLRQRLLDDGILTWLDEKDLLPGDDPWKQRINEAIETSDFVLVFLSSTSLNKTGQFQRELRYALEQRNLRPEGTRYIIPLVIDQCDPPGSLREIQWLRAQTTDWYERLNRAILEHPTSPSHVKMGTQEQPASAMGSTPGIAGIVQRNIKHSHVENVKVRVYGAGTRIFSDGVGESRMKDVKVDVDDIGQKS